jgi:hypothetical protein
MAKKATTSVTSKSNADWPESINLEERLPKGHESAGYPRYAFTRNGKGRMDMTTVREVPQPLVDAALKAQAEAEAAAQPQSEAA